jgi:glycosyltransferase involved in cell wall biosynthesis
MALLSIITVVYNRKVDIEKTLKSVTQQQFNDFEYIVIDANSTDGTKEFLQAHEEKIDILISEKDHGIYDAMNKGLRLAKGKFVTFMNAGDTFDNKYVLQHIFDRLPENTDAIYGDTLFVDAQDNSLGLMSEVRKRPLKKDFSWKDMKEGMLFCHQSFIIKKSLCTDYSLQYPLSADIDWIINGLKHCQKTYFFEESPIAHFQLGGASHQNHFASLKDRFYVLNKHFGFFLTLFVHFKLIFK